MTINNLRYMVEVERTGSITRAAASLMIGQPNLSKAIRDVEKEIGVPIFMRSAKGVVPTEKGREFLQYAKTILVQMDRIDNLSRTASQGELRFSLLLPRASYVTYAFTRFLKKFQGNAMDVRFKETNSVEAVTAVGQGEYELAVVRCPVMYESYYRALIEENNTEVLGDWRFEHVLLTNAGGPLAKVQGELTEAQLEPFIEILHGDEQIPNISEAYQRREEMRRSHRRHIYVYERGSQFDILASCPDSYMWVSPMPRETLDRYGLRQIKAKSPKGPMKDLLIYPSGSKLDPAQLEFISELEKVRKELEVRG